MLSKSELRSKLRYERQIFVKSQNSSQIQFDRRIETISPLIDRCKIVAGYDCFGSEVSVAAIMSLSLAKGKDVALPFVTSPQRSMQFKYWTPDTPLAAQSLGFRQPVHDAADATPDLILVPLIGFDRNLNRLGQGGGFYDRYLSNNINVLKIGIAWSCQEVTSVPVDIWDVKLDAILTEKEWIASANSVIAE